MRLISKKEVADSISMYDFLCESTISIYNTLYITNGQLGARQFEKLFEAQDLLDFYMDNKTGAIVTNIPDSLSIRINTTELNSQLNFMMQEKAYANQEINRCAVIKEKAKILMALIKKEYYYK